MTVAAGHDVIFERSIRRFVWRLMAASALGFAAANLCLLGLNYLVLRNGGEGLSVADSLRRQMATGGLQSSAFDDAEMSPQMKVARYAAYKPDVIAIGTSRVTQLRPDAFRGSFVNMGMTFILDRAPDLAETLVAIHKPKLVLVGVDWFRFNEAYPQPDPVEDVGPFFAEWRRTITTWPRSVRGWLAYRRNVLMQPTRWLFEGKLSPLDYLRALFGATPHIGIPAIAEGSGMGPRGSRYYGRIAGTDEEHWQWKKTLSDVRDGRGKHKPVSAASEARWRLYVKMVETFEAAGAIVVPFMPPVAQPVLEAMDERGGFGIFEDLRRRLRSYHGYVHDFTRPASIGSPNCEFVDGMHGGEVTYLRLLSKLAALHPEVREIVARETVARRIKRYAGRAAAYDALPTGEPIRERDFLGIGCEK